MWKPKGGRLQKCTTCIKDKRKQAVIKRTAASTRTCVIYRMELSHLLLPDVLKTCSSFSWYQMNHDTLTPIIQSTVTATTASNDSSGHDDLTCVRGSSSAKTQSPPLEYISNPKLQFSTFLFKIMLISFCGQVLVFLCPQEETNGKSRLKWKQKKSFSLQQLYDSDWCSFV